MASELNMRRGAAAVLFLLGMDTGYNVGSFSLSAPQTTERRVKDMEGKGETPKEAMGWVWISTVKVLVYTVFSSMLAANIWPLIGGIVVVIDVHASYRYAIHRGKRACTPGGRAVAQAMNGSGNKAAAPLFPRP